MSLSSRSTATLRMKTVLPSLSLTCTTSSIIVFKNQWLFFHHSLSKRICIYKRFFSWASLGSIIWILKCAHCASGRDAGLRGALSIMWITFNHPPKCLIFYHSFGTRLILLLFFFNISRRVVIRTLNLFTKHTISSYCIYNLLKDRFVCILLGIRVKQVNYSEVA